MVAAAHLEDPDDDALDPDEEPSRSKRFAIILVALLILAALIAGGIVAALNAGSSTVEVPDVTDRPLAEATDLLKAKGFEVEATAQPNADVGENVVYRTDPVAGVTADEGSTVTLIYNPSAGPVEVPKVTGLQVGDALKLLVSKGFTNVTPQDADGAEGVPGTVVSQNPVAGSEKPVADKITLRIVPFPVLKDIPEVAGLSVDEATARLQAAGFIVASTSSQASNSTPAGKVIGTDPNGEQEEGSELTLFVSSGPSSVKVPDVEGSAEQAARQRLQERGLKASTETVRTEDPSLDGIVLSSNPGVGESVDANSTVTLRVGSYRAPVTAAPTTAAPTAPPSTKAPVTSPPATTAPPTTAAPTTVTTIPPTTQPTDSPPED